MLFITYSLTNTKCLLLRNWLFGKCDQAAWLLNAAVLDRIYTDLEKAFYNIPHMTLILKIRNYNVHPGKVTCVY